MEYRVLGHTSLNISRLAFGCMSLKKNNSEAASILQKACAEGINFFDTADLYEQGANEELLGNALREKRKEIFIATKVGNQWREDGTGWDWNPSYAYIMKAVEESLRRLKTDHIDLYQLHGGTIDDPMDETIGAFEELVRQGKILYYGISSIRPAVIKAWVDRSRLSSVMVQYSLLDRRPEESVLPLLQQKGIGVLVRGALAQGLLMDKPAKPYLGHREDEVEQAAQAIAALAGKESKTVAAMGYVWKHPAVTSIVAGIHTMYQLNQAMDACRSASMTENNYRVLCASIPPNLYTEHR